MTKSMVTPEFAAALKRIEAERAAKAAEKPAPPIKVFRRSVLQTSGLPESSGSALVLLGATYALGRKPDGPTGAIELPRGRKR